MTPGHGGPAHTPADRLSTNSFSSQTRSVSVPQDASRFLRRHTDAVRAQLSRYRGGEHCRSPSAQIRTRRTKASGSYLGCLTSKRMYAEWNCDDDSSIGGKFGQTRALPKSFWHSSTVGIMQSVFSTAAGHHRLVACKRLIRAGKLKTCGTRPQGTAAPQLCGLQ